ncbi:MAG TPA: M48 family metalloprotease [Steroidobacteraceae bacterium]|nr:M48 family metalloprotease [Steroidobacteraceae bacterium]HRX89317.1 M48 family metalloprotease [Steroidobacteraceae bacterium]
MDIRLRTIVWVALLAAIVTGCGTNPVTGKTEVQLISTGQEVQIGEQNYAPSRQSQGGDLTVLPELTAYVSEVGQKLAAVSDRDLPYEFVVLNSSVPNAWALPGGKIAVNRGLLTTLENEAELAAVLGHEIVHAAARHGAKAQERGTFLQIGMVAAQVGMAMSDTNPNVGNLLLQGAGLGAQMAMMKYGRDAELEADQYGMNYMRAAGYNPQAAVSLQQKFLALSEQSGRNQGWLEGLFASHPPSAERVARNRERLAEIGSTGDLGAERYQAKLAPLMAMKPAYDKADAALEAAGRKDFNKAEALAREAVKLVPREPRFHQLLGDLALAQKQPQAALPHYERSIALDSTYFGPYLGGGVAAYRLNDKARAEDWLTRSVKLLPTAPAAYYLGTLAKEQGNMDRALDMFRAAAGSESDIGKQAAAEYTRLDLPRNPGNYVKTGLQLDGRGELLGVIENRAPVALRGIVITPIRIDGAGRIVQSARSVQIGQTLAPGQRIAVNLGLGPVAPELAQQLRVRVDGATPVE